MNATDLRVDELRSDSLDLLHRVEDVYVLLCVYHVHQVTGRNIQPTVRGPISN